MLEKDYKNFLPKSYNDEEKEKIINDLIFLTELILESEDLMKIVNKLKL
jgi:hypothetical protein